MWMGVRGLFPCRRVRVGKVTGVPLLYPVNSPPETFATPRLDCRRTAPGDAAAIFEAYGTDPEVTRYLMWKPYSKVEPLIEFLSTQIDAWEQGTSFRYEICLKGTQTPIGSIALRPEGSKVNFGYVLAKPFWGRGLMTEALKHLVDWSLDQPDVFRAYAVCDVDNPSSARVMEKAGMIREGVLRRWLIQPNIGAEPRDCIIFARTR